MKHYLITMVDSLDAKTFSFHVYGKYKNEGIYHVFSNEYIELMRLAVNIVIDITPLSNI